MYAHHIDFLELLNGQVQYVVPRWQRRYRWGQSDIERLVEDLVTVSVAGPDAAHYGGTLLTFPEPGPAGVVKTFRVVDGQPVSPPAGSVRCPIRQNRRSGRCRIGQSQKLEDNVL